MLFRNTQVQSELQELAPLLAQMPRTNPFVVPANYFQGTQQYWGELADEEALLQLPSNVGKDSHFAVPAAYFNELHDQILLHLHADQLPDEPPQLVSLPSKNSGMTVPVAYFEELHESIMNQLDSEKTEAVLNLRPAASFKVPENYFDNFAANLLQKIPYLNDTEPQTPTLDKLRQQPSFVVPAQYFADTHEQIMQRTQQGNSTTKVVQMPSGRINPPTTDQQRYSLRTILRYSLSTAAMLAMIVVGVQFINQDNPSQPNNTPNMGKPLATNDAQSLIGMPKEDLLALMDRSISSERALAAVSEEIEEYDDLMEEESFISTIDMKNTQLEEVGIKLTTKDVADILSDID